MRKRVPFPVLVQIKLPADSGNDAEVSLNVKGSYEKSQKDRLEFTITPHMTLEEAALQIIALDPKAIPQFLESAVLQMLSDGVDKYVKQRAHASLQGLRSPVLSETAVSPLMSDAQLEHTSFINTYAKLVHTRVFDQLLDLEIEMARQVCQLLTERDNVLKSLRERYKSESLANISEDRRKSIQQQRQEEIDLMSVTFASQLEDMYLQQRLKYRRQVMNVNINDQSIELSPPPLPARKQSISTDSDSIVVTEPAETVPVPKRPPISNPNVSSLMEMGFSEEQANCACILTNNNLEQAIVILLEDVERVNRTVAENRSVFSQNKPITTPPTSSQNNNIVMMKQETSSSWSPRSFLEQQLPTAKSQFTNWLDKARSQLDDLLLEDTSRTSSPLSPVNNLTNIFTVSFGNHTKNIHNIILESADSASLFQWPRDPVTERGIRAQTCATLYSKQLNGIVILVDTENIELYKFGKTSNQYLFTACSESTELHFDTIENQIRKAEEQPNLRDSQKSGFKDGDFIITKHSNLPATHVVFHLFASKECLQGEINQRSQVMVGLRNLLRIAGKYGIVNLTVPLIFLDSQNQVQEPAKTKLTKSLSRSTSLQALAQFASGSNSNSQKQSFSIPRADLLKRSETVLKTLKSHLLESSMNANKSNNSANDSITGSTKFIVPKEIVKQDDQFWGKVNESIRVLFRAV